MNRGAVELLINQLWPYNPIKSLAYCYHYIIIMLPFEESQLKLKAHIAQGEKQSIARANSREFVLLLVTSLFTLASQCPMSQLKIVYCSKCNYLCLYIFCKCVCSPEIYIESFRYLEAVVMICGR